MKTVLKKKYRLTSPIVAKLWFGEKYLIVKWGIYADSIKRFRDAMTGKVLLDAAEYARVMRYRRKIGRDLIDRETGKTVRVVFVAVVPL